MFSPVTVESRSAPPPAALDAGLLTALRLRPSPAAAVLQLTPGPSSAEVCRSPATGKPPPTAFLLLILSTADKDRLAAAGLLSVLQCHSITNCYKSLSLEERQTSHSIDHHWQYTDSPYNNSRPWWCLADSLCTRETSSGRDGEPLGPQTGGRAPPRQGGPSAACRGV